MQQVNLIDDNPTTPNECTKIRHKTMPETCVIYMVASIRLLIKQYDISSIHIPKIALCALFLHTAAVRRLIIVQFLYHYQHITIFYFFLSLSRARFILVCVSWPICQFSCYTFCPQLCNTKSAFFGTKTKNNRIRKKYIPRGEVENNRIDTDKEKAIQNCLKVCRFCSPLNFIHRPFECAFDTHIQRVYFEYTTNITRSANVIRIHLQSMFSATTYVFHHIEWVHEHITSTINVAVYILGRNILQIKE